MKLFNRWENRLPSFWTIQITGWLVYLVMIYITFLTVAQPENFLPLFYLKAFRTFLGFCLTCVLRIIYKRFGERLRIGQIVALVLICASIFGCVWAGVEGYYRYLTEAKFDVPNFWARFPRLGLDYAMTLTAWSALYFGIKSWWQWQTERENALKSAALANQAQLEMLRYQLNPHFLFNTLNSIRASIDEDTTRAREMITQLSEFLRYSLLSCHGKEAPLSEEIEALKNYLAIEKTRFEDKLEISFDIDPTAEDFRVPCFLLNPLIENAVKHGFANNQMPLKIQVSARLKRGEIVIEVANTGTLKSVEKTSGTRVGLKNIRERLDKMFSDGGQFNLFEENGWVRAVIEIKRDAIEGVNS